MSDSTTIQDVFDLRWLQESVDSTAHPLSRARLVLSVLYLVVLFSCICLPFVYYICLYCLERRERVRQDMMMAERAAIRDEVLRAQQQADEEERRQEVETKQKLLNKSFQALKLNLTKFHFPKVSPNDVETGQSNTLLSDDRPNLSIPKRVTANEVEMKKVPNCCAICLVEYEIGDTIVWSSNSACEHMFHESCITKWLMKTMSEVKCPCCRQDFIKDWAKEEESSAQREEPLVNNNTTTSGDN